MKKIILFFAVFSYISIFSQEISIPAILSVNQSYAKKLRADTLELPFIDDFSKTFPDPNPQLWYTNTVNITRTAAVYPPSLGCAVFDAVDNQGNFNTSYYEENFKSDFLVSQPINLNYVPADNIYLSFYYEPQGFLDNPEPQDSLVLQFFAPMQNKWITVWSAPGSENVLSSPVFRQVILPVTDTAFLHKGFKFRFYNRCSLSGSQHPDLVGNSDFWFIDYVILDKNRSADDTLLRELAIQYPADFKFDNYTQMPYSHYKQAENQLNINLQVKIRNNDRSLRSIDSAYIVWTEKNNAVPQDILYLGSYIIPPQTNAHIDAENIQPFFPDISSDALFYDMKSYFRTDAYDSVFNNFVHQDKNLGVLYAYDDGTAENAYGLIGDDTKFAYVAQKFYTYKTDYLTGVQIYFNKTFKDNYAQPYYFALCVWENDQETGKPGELILHKDGMEINHDLLNSFQTYVLDTPVMVSDTFYLGWQKLSQDFLNIGLDLSFSPDDNLKYYNIFGQWTKSSLPGVIMIRPIFGAPALNVKQIPTNNVKVYPNPASGIIRISLNSGEQLTNCSVLSLTGKKLLTSKSETIDVSSLPPGVYLIEIQTDKDVYLQKIVKK